jgi:hypothetical protein
MTKEAPTCVSCRQSSTYTIYLQITSLTSTTTIRLGCCELRQRLCIVTSLSCLVCLDLRLVASDQFLGFLMGASDLGFPPAGWAPAVAMLDKQMSSPDLVPRWCKGCGCDALGAVVCGHELLELLRVGSRRRLPSRVFGFRVEVVWQVLGVGAAHLPALGQTGFLRGL